MKIKAAGMDPINWTTWVCIWKPKIRSCFLGSEDETRAKSVQEDAPDMSLESKLGVDEAPPALMRRLRVSFARSTN